MLLFLQNHIIIINSFLKSKLSQDQQNNNEDSPMNQQERRQNSTRSVPSLHRVLGVVPKQVHFGVQLPFKTPTKLKNKVDKKEVSEPICQMYKQCTGRLVQLVEITKK